MKYYEWIILNGLYYFIECYLDKNNLYPKKLTVCNAHKNIYWA